MSKLTFRK